MFTVWAQQSIGDERGNSEHKGKSEEIMQSKEERKKRKINRAAGQY